MMNTKQIEPPKSDDLAAAAILDFFFFFFFLRPKISFRLCWSFPDSSVALLGANLLN
jgi:hypothetical protein